MRTFLVSIPRAANQAIARRRKVLALGPFSSSRTSTYDNREASSMHTWTYSQPIPRARLVLSPVILWPTPRILPSFLMSRCSSSPGCSFSYRRIGSGGANCFNRPRPTRLSHLATVERGQPVQLEISAPLNLRSRKETILLSCFCGVLLGIRCGLEDRSIRPAKPSARYLASHR